MNIKEHIEAGHYERDSKGRALVKGTGGHLWTILCTDKPGDHPIVGFRDDPSAQICSFPAHHDTSGDRIFGLLPPPPRKVKVSYPALVSARDGSVISIGNRPDALLPNERAVTLTGEYEEPWA